ncbi:MAG: hypothetical protein EOO54_24250 [Haliea sp.]|nr:MAG: hypothetical protein EOO54_24250 [Haliea sp.]
MKLLFPATALSHVALPLLLALAAGGAHAQSAGGAATLPAEVQEQIRAEVRSQMEAKLDSLLAAVIRGARSAGAGAGSDERDAREVRHERVMSGALDQANGAAAPADADTIPAFCTAVIRASEVQDTVVPLISLLVTFASSRLQEASS